MNKKLILLFIIIGVFAVQNIALADIPLEINYPNIPFNPDNANPASGFPQYAAYIFYFAISISGLIAFGVIIRAGFNWMTASGMPNKIKEAQEQITSAVIGIIILFGSWMILYAINPAFLNFQLSGSKPVLPDLPSGVLLCSKEMDIRGFWNIRKSAENMSIKQQTSVQTELMKRMKDIDQYCWIASQGDLPSQITGKAVEAHVIPGQNNLYGAILYEKQKFGGKSQVVYTNLNRVASFDIKNDATSIKPFVIKNDTLGNKWYVELFELPDYNKADNERNHQKETIASNFRCYGINLPIEKGINTDHQLQSIKVEGDFIVILFKNRKCGESWSGSTELYVLTNSDADLNDNLPITTWCGNTDEGQYSCAESMTVVNGGVY